MRQIYIEGVSGTSPSFTTSTGPELEAAAKRKLQPESFAYVAGSASSETTASNNRKALDDWQIIPNMLGGVDVSEFNSQTTLFGEQFATPLIVSPIGVQSQLNEEEADCATANAAKDLEVPFVLSSAGDRSMEDLMKQCEFEDPPSPQQQQEEGRLRGAEAWYQLYWPSDDRLTESIVKRAKKAGYRVLVVTLDTWILGWRPRDLNTAYNPFLNGKGLAQILSDPYFISQYCEGKDPRGGNMDRDDFLGICAAAVSLLNPGISRSWEELSILRDLWGDGPIVLKGIQSPADAARALSSPAAIDGIIVSNHGGRQVDGAVGSLQALPTIAAMCRQKGKTCIFDSGIRTGADVFKALALGEWCFLREIQQACNRKHRD